MEREVKARIALYLLKIGRNSGIIIAVKKLTSSIVDNFTSSVIIH
jgi:hypothetical protein